MRNELQKAIKTALVGDGTLTTALGSAGQIEYGWPYERMETNSTDKKAVLAWGADIIEGANPEISNAASKRLPDADVPFHLFSHDPNLLNTAADALFDLWSEETMDTTNCFVLRISLASDTGTMEEERSWYHRVVVFSFSEVWKK